MYDFIVVGVTFPGLFLGAMLARRGKRVLLLERQRGAGGRISLWEREGFLSLQGIPRIRYGEQGAFSRTCGRVGLPLHLEPLNQAWILDTDGKLKRITVGRPGPLMGDFLSPWDRFTALRVLRSLDDERLEELEEISLESWFLTNKIRSSFRKYLQVLAYESTHCTDLDRISAGETLRCFRNAYRSRAYLAYPKKGWKEILESLQAEVEKNGEIRWESRVEGIEVVAGEATGVRVGGEHIPAGKVVCAIPCQKMIRLLPRDATTREYDRLCRGAEPSAALVVDLALDRRVFKKKGLWFFLDPPCYGTFPSNLNYVHAPAGKQLATFVCPCSQRQSRQPGFIQTLQKKIEENLHAALPGIDIPVAWMRSRVVRLLDSIGIRADQTRADRPGYSVPGVQRLFLVGDSTCAPGGCWEMEYESVLTCFDRVLGTEA